MCVIFRKIKLTTIVKIAAIMVVVWKNFNNGVCLPEKKKNKRRNRVRKFWYKSLENKDFKKFKYIDKIWKEK